MSQTKKSEKLHIKLLVFSSRRRNEGWDLILRGFFLFGTAHSSTYLKRYHCLQRKTLRLLFLKESATKSSKLLIKTLSTLQMSSSSRVKNKLVRALLSLARLRERMSSIGSPAVCFKLLQKVLTSLKSGIRMRNLISSKSWLTF